MGECNKGILRRIEKVIAARRMVVLECGHLKEWPESYVTIPGVVAKAVLPSVGQRTMCHMGECCEACHLSGGFKILTVYKRSGADWACTKDQSDIKSGR